MSKLMMKMKYKDAKWPLFLEDTFGKEFADQCVVESTQTASVHDAKIQILDFKADKNILQVIKSNENVLNAFLVENNEVIETIK